MFCFTRFFTFFINKKALFVFRKYRTTNLGPGPGYAFCPGHPWWFGALFTFKTLFLSLAEEIKLFLQNEWQNHPFWTKNRKHVNEKISSFEILVVRKFWIRILKFTFFTSNKHTVCKKMQVYSRNNLCNSAKFSCKLLFGFVQFKYNELETLFIVMEH